MANDWFYVLPEIDIKKLESLFRHKVLKLLLSEKRISEELVEKLLSWKIPVSAFTIRSKSKAGTAGGGKAWPNIFCVPPFSLEKITYQQQTKTVLYRSKMNPSSRKTSPSFPSWIATLTTHIPNKGEQLIRYYGYYSNVSREKEKKRSPKTKPRLARSMPRRYPRN